MTESGTCQICGLRSGKYHCPKCKLPYCSLECYQSEAHLQCSEQFYEQCVEEEMKDCKSDPEIKQRMMEILLRQQEIISEENLNLDSDDEECMADLSSRLADVDLDNGQAVWEKLNLEERREFKKLVATGDIMEMLPEWEPWWKTKKKKSLIQDCDEEEFDLKSLCPEIPFDVPDLSHLTTRSPSPEVAYMVLNVLLSYIFTVRWFKGAHKELPVEGISTCIALSATLRESKIFRNSIEAFATFDEDVSRCEWVQNEDRYKDIYEDLEDIIKGSYEGDLFYCTKAAICDLHSLCLLALEVVKENKTNHLRRFSGPPPKATLLQHISRKMVYYLSWIVEHGSSLSNVLKDFTPGSLNIVLVEPSL